MNILIDKLPEALEIEGELYPIHTDFRVWIRFALLFSESKVEMAQKFAEAIPLCFDLSKQNKLPPTLQLTLTGLFEFYAGDKKDDKANKIVVQEKQKRIYSFEFDAPYIYAAFLAQYGIDLKIANLHWWQFNALFSGLNEDNKICKIMGYRAVELDQVKDKTQKAFYRKMQNLYRLPDMRTDEEMEADIAACFDRLI